jgi:hypothetical protein
MTRQDAGRIGGLQTALLHGREEAQRRGRLGGRPRNLTYSQIVASTEPLRVNKFEGGKMIANTTMGQLPTKNLRKLKRLYLAKMKVQNDEY